MINAPSLPPPIRRVPRRYEHGLPGEVGAQLLPWANEYPRRRFVITV